MSTIVIRSTGLKQRARRTAFPEQVPGKHLWILAGCWRVDPKKIRDREVHLDTENLLSVDGPGCFWCEETYTPELAAKPCRGRGLPTPFGGQRP